MLEKIERIARIKRVENDVAKRFDRKSGYKDEQNSKKKFSKTLQNAVDKSNEVAATVQLSDSVNMSSAVSVHLTATPSHSLFYMSGLSLNQLILNG